MKLLTAGLIATIAVLLAIAPAEAQDRQVPLDEQGRVQVVDAGLARQLGLWTEQYPGFSEARLFEDRAGGFVLEITTVVAGETMRERIPLTAADVAALRTRVSSRLTASRLLTSTEQEGRYLLLGQTTLLGIAFYSWAVPEILGAEETAAAGLGLLTAGVSFFAPFALTQNQPVTFGMANLSRYGATRGIAHGALVHQALAGSEETCFTESCADDRTDRRRARLASSVAFSVVEGVGGYLWARNEEMTAGTANAIVTLGDAGLLGGLGVARVAGLSYDDRAMPAMGLAGAAGGIVAGRALAARRDYTWGDADLLYTGGAVGAFAGLAAAALASVDSDRTAIALTLVGGTAGLVTADRLVADTDFTVGQSVLNRLGSVAGGLAGASIGVLLDDSDVALAGAGLGAIGGYLLTYAALAPDARAQRGERYSNWDVRLDPRGMIGLARGAPRAEEAPVPLFGVSYRFGSGGAR
jgi:hypothetical protein